MSKSTELHNLCNSFSGDCAVATYSRSGDSTGAGAARWDFIASVQSAEADLIDEEERAERREAKRKFARLLGLYLKKILTPVELKYIAACMKSDKTPSAVGRALSMDYKAIMASINAKHKKNEPKLMFLMHYSGYDFRHGLEFLPRLNKYYKTQLRKKQYYEANREYFMALMRAWHIDNFEKYRAYYEANREKYIKRRADYEKAHPDKKKEWNYKYKSTHREELRLKNIEYREKHRAEINARRRAKNAAKRAKLQQEGAAV